MRAKDPKTGLTDKQEAFARAVAKDPNLSDSDAYRLVYNTSRMKPETVNRSAHELKTNHNVAARIAELREQLCQAAQIDATYVLKRLAAIDEADVADLFNDDGTVKQLREWPKVWRQYVKGVEVTELMGGKGSQRALIGLVKKVQFPDKTKILELLGKHVAVGAFKEKVEHSGNIGMVIAKDEDAL